MTIKAPGDSIGTDVALVPSGPSSWTSLPVCISSINKDTNSIYYKANKRNTTLAPVNGVYNEEYEGFTTLLTTKPYPVVKDTTYHIKLAIADISDKYMDSAVW